MTTLHPAAAGRSGRRFVEDLNVHGSNSSVTVASQIGLRVWARVTALFKHWGCMLDALAAAVF